MPDTLSTLCAAWAKAAPTEIQNVSGPPPRPPRFLIIGPHRAHGIHPEAEVDAYDLYLLAGHALACIVAAGWSVTMHTDAHGCMATAFNADGLDTTTKGPNPAHALTALRIAVAQATNADA